MTISPVTIAAFAIATVVPLVFMWVIRKFDLYATGTFRLVAACLFAGVFAFFVALLINDAMLENEIVTLEIFQWVTAPIIEEILKSLFLIYLIRRKDFHFFVDGAIYGFAVGIGFAIIENGYYLYNNPRAVLGIAIARVLSTNLVHASGSALIGISLGIARFEKPPKSILYALGGYVAAMVLHMGYNYLVTTLNSSLLLLYAAGVGFGAGIVIYFMIRRGLADEKKYIEEKLVEETTVTAGETAIVNRLSESSKILAPLSKKFGPKKAQQVGQFLTLQAHLGIKRKMVEKLPDPKMRQGVEAEMAEIRTEMDVLRRSVGTYAMMYVRTIFPETGSPLFGRLETLLSERASQPSTSTTNTFQMLSGKISATAVMKAAQKASDESGDTNG
jgi:RsiW-degrading membrane proteinase PrsW (M82 family)